MFDYFKEYFDARGFFLTIGLVIVGLISVFSATYDAGAGAIYQRQILWAGAGFIGMLVAAFLPLKTVQRLAVPSYVAVLLFLLVLLLVGKTVSGSKSWFGVGGFGIQPSEFAKPATILALAAFLSKTTTSIADPKHLFATIALVAVPMGLVLVQPDMGTGIVFFAMLLPVLYWAGADNFVLAVILSPIIVAAGALFGTTFFILAVLASLSLLIVTRKNLFTAAVAFGITIAVGLSVQMVFEKMPTYQQKRIMTFLNPEADPLGAGYNVLQSKVAIGSGGVFGKGYLQGTQTQLNFIPEQWTDFIFCVPGEEFGFFGASIVLVVAIFFFALPKIADFSDVWTEIGAMTPIELGAMLVATLWNIFTYWFVMMSSLPGSNIWQTMKVNQASTAVANTLPGGGAIGVGVTYGM
ncbi:MAG: rod shape-determining protein RodA, partial [Bacteroidota bacterium]